MTKSNIKIVAIGDSITFGFPYSPRESWVAEATMRTNIEIINKGINGDLTSDMAARFNRDAVMERPSHVIILGGANDAYAAIDKEVVLDNIMTMCNIAEENNIIPIIGQPTPSNDKWEEYRLSGYRSMYQGYAREKGYTIIDFFNSLFDKENGSIKDGFHVDGLHPSIEGYLSMAETAIEVISKL